ncbi:MAG: hypothetical protein ACLSHG_10525 [Oscillospiraceae bacterium]
MGSGVLLTALMPVAAAGARAACAGGSGALRRGRSALARHVARAARRQSRAGPCTRSVAALILFAYSAYATFTGLRPCFARAVRHRLRAPLAGEARGASWCAARFTHRCGGCGISRARARRLSCGTAWGRRWTPTRSPRDVVRVLPGERVPVDGVVCSGTCTVDASALTGAARPAGKGGGGRSSGRHAQPRGQRIITPTAIERTRRRWQRTIAALQRAQTVRTPEQVRLERRHHAHRAARPLAIGVGAAWLFWRAAGRSGLRADPYVRWPPQVPARPGRPRVSPRRQRSAERPSGRAAHVGSGGVGRADGRTVRRCIWPLLAYQAVCRWLRAG